MLFIIMTKNSKIITNFLKKSTFIFLKKKVINKKN